MKGENDILGSAAAMVEAERTAESIEIGDGSVTTTLEGATGRVRGNNDDLQRGSVESGNEEFISIKITRREESFATGIVGKFISDAQAGPKLIRRKGLIVTEQFHMRTGTGHTATVSLSIDNAGVR
jgi:hypothetical protein